MSASWAVKALKSGRSAEEVVAHLQKQGFAPQHAKDMAEAAAGVVQADSLAEERREDPLT